MNSKKRALAVFEGVKLDGFPMWYGADAETDSNIMKLVRKETRRIIEILGGDNRYIVALSHDYLLPEIPAENIVAMYV